MEYKRITISMDETLLKAIQAQAEKDYLSVSAFLRKAANKLLDEGE